MNDYADINYLNVPSSFWGRYTMEFYVYVKDITLLTKGVNFIWKNHIAISIVSDTITATSLRVLCFPQEYKSKVDGTYGSAQLVGLLSSTTNSDSFTYPSSNATWLWIRCGYSQIIKSYYLKNKLHFAC